MNKLSARRWVLAIALGITLFCVGTESDALFAAFSQGWRLVLHAVGLGGLLDRLQHGTSQQVTTRSLPAVLTYGVLYVGLCLLLLWVLLRDARSWQLAAKLYAGVVVLIALLLVAGKLGGDVVVLYRIARQLIDFLVSPLPVMILVPLFSPAVRRSLARR